MSTVILSSRRHQRHYHSKRLESPLLMAERRQYPKDTTNTSPPIKESSSEMHGSFLAIDICRDVQTEWQSRDRKI